jgi:hypothetical protein
MVTADSATTVPHVEAPGGTAPSRTDSASAVPTAGQGAPNAGPPAGSGPSDAQVIPGAELLGRGIYIKPGQPYELKGLLLNAQEESKTRVQYIGSVGRSYIVPGPCEVNESPPLPAGKSIGQTIIEQSWNRFGREFTLNANAAASAKTFSVDATSFHGSNLKAEKDSIYALRSSFIPFWSLYLPGVDPGSVIEEVRELEKDPTGSEKLHLPVGPFDPLNRARYTEIFDRFGTHYIKSAWLGGAASLVFVVRQTSDLSTEDVKASIEITFAGKAGTSNERKDTQERFRSNSTCTVFGSGGSPTALANLASLDPDQYKLWVNSVSSNPEVIEFGVAGIWTLLKDEVKAQALRQAYLQESKFSPLSAIVPVSDWMIFTKGDEAFDYAMTSKYGASRLYVASCLFIRQMIKKPEILRDKLEQASIPGTPVRDTPADKLALDLAEFLNSAVLSGEPVSTQGPFSNLLKKKLSEDDSKNPSEAKHFSRRTRDLLSNPGTRVVIVNRLLLEEAFPEELEKRSLRLSLPDYLPMLKNKDYGHFRQPHAAFSLYGFGNQLNSKIYLFKYRECLRIDDGSKEVDAGYPKPLSEEWPDVHFDRIDAAVSVAPGKVYFFRGADYIRLDRHDGQWKLGARDPIKDRWPGVVFDKIDTAAYWGDNKFYFFSEDKYIRYDLGSHQADPGYPKFLSSNYVEDWEVFD